MLYPYKLTNNRTRNANRRFRSRLRVEELEARTLLSTYTPSQIVHAYGIDQINFSGVKGDGTGQTIAIVDAYYDPTIQSDLATFSTKFNLPQLDGKSGHGTFTQIDLSNKTKSPPGWTVETALDVEWAHAVAPKANIALVEAKSDLQDPVTSEPTDLLNAVSTAANTAGVVTVSMSWGITEVPGETNWDSFFTKPGVTYLAASGDSGAGTIWPSVSPNVVSVGGTTLKLTKSGTIGSETGWGYGNLSGLLGGSGGGFSQYEALPSYQSGITASGGGFKYTSFGVRLNPDVAYDADPNTGVYVYDGADGGWFAVGGTSAGAPQWAGLVAIADQGRALAGLSPLSSTQTLSAIYANPGDFHDITKGSTGTYYVVNSQGQIIGQIPVVAQSGYDLVTGVGTPKANLLVPALAKVTTTASAAGLASSSRSSRSSASSGSSQGSGHKSQGVISAANSGTSQSPTTQNNLLAIAASSLSAAPANVVPSNSPIVPPVPAAVLAPQTAGPVTGLRAPAPVSSGTSLGGVPTEDDDDPDLIDAPAVTAIASPIVESEVAAAGTQPAPAARYAWDVGFIQDQGVQGVAPEEQAPSTLAGVAVEPVSLLGVAAVVALAYGRNLPRAKPVPSARVRIARLG